MTSYVVLRKADQGSGQMGWLEMGPPVDAVDSNAAIRKAVEDKNVEGQYVAVPMRSFQIVTVSVETKRTVKIG